MSSKAPTVARESVVWRNLIFAGENCSRPLTLCYDINFICPEHRRIYLDPHVKSRSSMFNLTRRSLHSHELQVGPRAINHCCLTVLSRTRLKQVTPAMSHYSAHDKNNLRLFGKCLLKCTQSENEYFLNLRFFLVRAKSCQWTHNGPTPAGYPCPVSFYMKISCVDLSPSGHLQ